jgi:hypothetical protein
MQQKLELFQKWQFEITQLQDKNLKNNDFLKNRKLQIYFENLTIQAIKHGDENLLFALLNPFLSQNFIKYDELCAMNDYYCTAIEIMKTELRILEKFLDTLENYYSCKMSRSLHTGMETQQLLQEIFESEKEVVFKQLPEAIISVANNRLIPVFWMDGIQYILPSQTQACFYHYAKHLQPELEEYKRLSIIWQPMHQKNLDKHYVYFQSRVNFLIGKIKNFQQIILQTKYYAHEFQEATTLLPSKPKSFVENSRNSSLDFNRKQTLATVCQKRQKIITYYIHDFIDSSDTESDDFFPNHTKYFDTSDDDSTEKTDNIKAVQFHHELKKILLEIGDFKEINAFTLRAVVLTTRIDPNLCLNTLRDSSPEIKSKTCLGDTLLHVAVREYYSQPRDHKKLKFSKAIIEQLTNFGANLFKKNSDGISAAHLIFEQEDKNLFDNLIQIIQKQPIQNLMNNKTQKIFLKNNELMTFVNEQLDAFKKKLELYAKRIFDSNEFPKNTKCFIQLNESLYEIIQVFSTKLLAYNVSKIEGNVHAPWFGKNQLWHIVKELKDQLFLLEQQDDKLRAVFTNAAREGEDETTQTNYLQSKLKTEINSILAQEPSESSINTTTTTMTTTNTETTTTSHTGTLHFKLPHEGKVDKSIKYNQLKINYDRLFKQSQMANEKNILEKKELAEDFKRTADDLQKSLNNTMGDTLKKQASEREDSEQKLRASILHEVRSTQSQLNSTSQETSIPMKIPYKKLLNMAETQSQPEEVTAIGSPGNCFLF